jgi:hypothetical protein
MGRWFTSLLTLNNNSNNLFKFFLSAFVLRLTIAVITNYILQSVYDQPYWQFGLDGGDEKFFYESAERFKKAWIDGLMLPEGVELHEVSSYLWLISLGFMRYVAGIFLSDKVLVCKILTCFLGALIAPIAIDMYNHIYGSKSRFLPFLVVTFPDYLLFSATLMRDILVSLLLLIIIHQAAILQFDRVRYCRVIIIAIAFVMLSFVKFEAVPILPFVIFICFIVSGGNERGNSYQRYILIFAGVIFAVCGIVYFSSLYTFNYFLFKSTVGTGLAIEQATTGSLGSKILQLPLYVRAPLSAFHVLLAPVPPWGDLQARELTPLSLFYFFGGIFWWGIFAYFAVGLYVSCAKLTKRTIFLWLPILSISLMLGFAAGVEIRWRLMILPFMLIVAAHGVSSRNKFVMLKYIVNFLLLVICIYYSILKYS